MVTGYCACVTDDWSPFDPDADNVYYDMSAWSPDQEAELIEALVEAGVPHGWNERELVVPDDFEEQVDELFAEVEARLGIGDEGYPPLTTGGELPEDEPVTEYELEGWPVTDRTLLTESLVHVRIPHRWDGDTLLVPTAAEAVVDELLDDIEGGEVTIIDDGDGLDDADEIGADEEPVREDLMGVLFTAGDRLARNPLDADGLSALAAVLEDVDPERPPYGVSRASWAVIADLADRLGDALAGEEEPDEQAAIQVAEQLRDATRTD